MNWYAKDAPPDNIRWIRVKEGVEYNKRLDLIAKLPPVGISVALLERRR